MKNVKKKEEILPYLLIAPAVILVGLIIFYPIVYSLDLSLQEVSLIKLSEVDKVYIGINNYIELINNPIFWSALKKTIIYTIISVLSCFFIGLFTALLLDNKFFGKKVVRTLVLLPWATPYLVTCLVWYSLFDPRVGVINFILHKLNIIDKSVAWLFSSSTSLIVVIIVTIWKLFPFATIIILAGLQTIPKTLYEAAEVDGANYFKKLIYIKIPCLSSVILVTLTLLTIWIFKLFTIIYVLTSGGPARATETLVIKTYIDAFKYYKMGSASALGIITLAIISLLVVLYYFIISKVEKE